MSRNKDLTLAQLQAEAAIWAEKNFGEQPAHRPLLGVAEEIGELCHAQLKMEQGIRVNEDHVAAAKDAVGDIVIYLADFCTKRGFSFQECVQTAWKEVSQRDWKKNPEKGIEAPRPCRIHEGCVLNANGLCSVYLTGKK